MASDVDAVWEIIHKCSEWLAKELKLDHWLKYYTREMVEKKFENQHVYVAKKGKTIVGTVTLDENPVEYYTEDDMKNFKKRNAKAVYITALAVDPDHQGGGVASQLLKASEQAAMGMEAKYIRFDCRADYKELIEFYIHRGYMIVGKIIDTEDNNNVYYLMEKRLGEKLQTTLN